MAVHDYRDPKHWIPKDVFAAYVGPDSEGLLAYYDLATAKRNPLVMSFDLLAVLALPAWLGYRRQWRLWGAFVGLFALLPFAEHLGVIQFPTSALGGVGLAMGMMARGLLLMAANDKYRRLRKRRLNAAEIASAISGQAKRSVPLAVVGGVGAVFAVLAVSLFADHLFE